MSPLCTVSTEHPPRLLVSTSSSSSACPADTREPLQRLHLKRCDEMRRATASREMKISASLVGDEVARSKTLHFSLCLLTLCLCFTRSLYSAGATVYATVCFIPPPRSRFTGFNLKIGFLSCPKIAEEKIIQHQRILYQSIFFFLVTSVFICA